MNRILTVIIMSAVLLASSCDSEKEPVLIGKQSPTIENGILTPEVLWAFGRIGDVEVSPDGTKILYTVSYYSIPENKSNTEIYVMNLDGSKKKQITKSIFRESSPKWFSDSEHIFFLSNESGVSQLWIMKDDGTRRRKISRVKEGIIDYKLSPDESKILYISDMKVKQTVAELHPDLPLATGYLADDLMYKHWDSWSGSVPHPFVAELSKKLSVKKAKDLLEGEPYESPVLPMGGIEQLAWSVDGKTIAYCSRKKTGKDYAVSTNTDIYFYDLESGTSKNVTEGNLGYDMNPVFSPDGKWMAWESQERDGYEADKVRLFVMNLQSGEQKDMTADFDQHVGSLAWSADSRNLYFTSVWHARQQVYQLEMESGAITQISKGDYDYKSVILVGGQLIVTRCSMSQPIEIYSLDQKTGDVVELSFENKEILDQLEMGRVEERWVTTTDNKQMLVWLIYPPHFDPNKKYPTILYCQGGPQSAVSQFWSYRWNMQTFAANDYIIVAPNRRGLPGFGQEWHEQISGDYGGQNMQDYLSAIDALSAEPYVDETRLGSIGASYGGFSVYWLAGHHEKRFKAFIAHAGIFNLEQQYLETEELWFANWDMGGAYWDKQNAIAQRTYANSPHLFVDKWDTPILVTHGEKDYRILASQGMSAFNAAILRGVPAQLLVYPDENHWVLKPQNGILWQRTFADWLDRWLK